MLTISLLDIKVGCRLSHLSKVVCILSRILDQMASSSIPLPTQPPSILVGSLSLAKCRLFGRGGPLWVIFLITSTSSRYSFVPIGIISVLSTLKRAPDAWHHNFRIDWSS